ncbi:hypothetical protein PHLGIDRAFT_118082 [Phlebiopsis gigantea 11061_1 CR5-6]|uniref:Uncharacterized protein n=1 Tax=Phlebiopsis gigantea (strain 11061_1 CR5-6) TaxID=745531 RepID=A0A0C3SB04_PHLG1|nr:hypothetical protein PHLGIDRAFT_118082 [Phlebiopsis gigantea 11061_1 CR5-6]
MSDKPAMDDVELPFLRLSPPVLLIPSTIAFALAARYFPFLRSRISRYGDDPSKKPWLFVCSYMLLLQCANVFATAWLHGSQSSSPLLLSRPFSEGSAAAKLAFLSVISITVTSM